MVERDIEEGRILLSKLKEFNIKVDFAAWVFSIEEEYWQLYIATPDYYVIGPGNLYLRTREAIDESFYIRNTEGTLTEGKKSQKNAVKIHIILSDIKLLSPQDNYVNKIIDAVGIPDEPSELSGRFFSGENSFTIGYVYPGSIAEKIYA